MQSLPSNPEAERMVIGCAILVPSLTPYLLELHPDDFSRPTMGTLFTVLKELHLSHTDINPVTIMECIGRYESTLGRSTGVTDAVVAETYEGCPRFSGPESVQSYIQAIKQAALRRRLIRYAESLSVRAAQPDLDPKDLLLDMSGTSNRLAQGTSLVTDLISTEDAVRRTLNKLEDGWERGPENLGLPTGFVDLDRHLMGLKPGVHVIAAGPNIGKTTFTLNVINNILLDAARRNEQRVGAVISMEMGVESLTTKMLATRARLSTRDIEAGTLTSEQRRSLMLAGQELGQQGLYFVEGFNAITPQAIEAKIQHIRAMRGRFDFLVVDYLQLLDPNRSNSSRYDATTDNSRDLTRMAHKYQIPILLISQLSREHVKRPNRDYILSDLRGSGAVEQDATSVMFLMPVDWDNEANPERRLVIAKDRSGPKGIQIPLLFIGEQSRFESMGVRF